MGEMNHRCDVACVMAFQISGNSTNKGVCLPDCSGLTQNKSPNLHVSFPLTPVTGALKMVQ